MKKPETTADNRAPFDELCEPIDSFLEQHEHDHPPHHLEKLHFADFVRKLIYHFAKNCESGRQLVIDLEIAPPELKLDEVKRSTFFETRCHHPFLRAAAHRFARIAAQTKVRHDL